VTAATPPASFVKLLRLASGLLAVVAIAGRGSETPAPAASPLPEGVRMPLSDMRWQTYLGFEGGLHPDGCAQAD
jgi:hypothetical protein